PTAGAAPPRGRRGPPRAAAAPPHAGRSRRGGPPGPPRPACAPAPARPAAPAAPSRPPRAGRSARRGPSAASTAPPTPPAPPPPPPAVPPPPGRPGWGGLLGGGLPPRQQPLRAPPQLLLQRLAGLLSLGQQQRALPQPFALGLQPLLQLLHLRQPGPGQAGLL